MRSDKQHQASKNNGRKSKGPVTDEGKARSAQNASTHNLIGEHFILLSNEDPEDFDIHESGFIRRFQPIDSVEYDLVQKMVIASWRERRIGIMESSLFEIEMERQRVSADAEFAELGTGPRQVLALFGNTEASAAAALLLRYGSAVRRQYASAYRILRDLQGDRFNRTGITASASEGSTRQHAQPTQSTSEPETSQLVATAHARKPETRSFSLSRPSLTIVRRYRSGQHLHLETTKLPNEPRQAAMTAASGWRNDISDEFPTGKAAA